jgi:hypothetical protein
MPQIESSSARDDFHLALVTRNLLKARHGDPDASADLATWRVAPQISAAATADLGRRLVLED